MPRLLHTADWRLNHQPARFEAVARLAALAHAERVDAVLVAGDALDDADLDEATLDRVRQALAAFAPIPVVLVPGDRDAAEPEGALDRLRPPAHVHTPRARALLAVGGLHVLACPRQRRHSDEDPLLGLQLPEVDGPLVVVAHGLARGMRGETPDTLQPERARGADWVALGGSSAGAQPSERVAWPGTPEPWGADLPGAALIVELTHRGAAPLVTRHPVAVTTWTSVRRTLAGALGDLPQALAAAPRPGVLKLELDGLLDLPGRAALDRALDEARRDPQLQVELDDQVRLDLSGVTLPAGVAADALQHLLARSDRVGQAAGALLAAWVAEERSAR